MPHRIKPFHFTVFRCQHAIDGGKIRAYFVLFLLMIFLLIKKYAIMHNLS